MQPLHNLGGLPAAAPVTGSPESPPTSSLADAPGATDHGKKRNRDVAFGSLGPFERRSSPPTEAASREEARLPFAASRRVFDSRAQSGEHKIAAQSQSQSAEATEMTEMTEAIDAVSRIRQRFQTLLDANWAPDQSKTVFDGDFDRAMLPTMVAAENARKPDLALVVLDDPHELKAWLAEADFPPEGKRALFPLPLADGLRHMVAADARCVDGKVSLLIIDPLTPTGDLAKLFHQELRPVFGRCIPDNTVLTQFMLSTQKARVGCSIFALSAASKLAGQKAMLDVIHRQNLAGQSFMTSLGQDARPWAGGARIRLMDGEGVFAPEFMKHSQSSATLQNWLKMNPPAYADATINKRGHTLQSRYQAFLTERHVQSFVQAQGQAEGQAADAPDTPDTLPRRWTELLRTSTSIEHKRLVFIDRTIEYLRTAPPSERRALLDRLLALDPARCAVDDLALERRSLGPKPGDGSRTQDAGSAS